MAGFFKDLFVEHTPIERLLEHAEILAEINNDFSDMLNNYLDKKNIDSYVEKIDELESKADDLKFSIRKMLTSRIKTTYAIAEMAKYLSKQELIIDLFEDVARKLTLNFVDGIDSGVKVLLLELAKLINLSVNSLLKMIDQIPDIMDSSFAKRFLKKEKLEVINLENLESKVDKVSYKIGRWIYSKKKELNPIDLMFLKELTLRLVYISDEVENAAELLAGLIK